MDKVHVVIRVRPLINSEQSSNETVHWKVQENTIWQLDTESQKKAYAFDRIFPPSSSSAEIFGEVAQPILDAVMEGYNGTIFAYGQTSSGKTHTMMGSNTDLGVIPRVAQALFESIEKMPLRKFLLRVSYIEIYNEKVFDLLKLEKKHLNVREDGFGKTFVENLYEEIVVNCEDLLDIMKKGELNRSYGSTHANEKSSRSHTIFTLTVESASNQEDEGAVNVSQLNLVDLAGSERASQSRSSGERFREGCAINTSLFTLRKVIKSLSQADGQFIGFRDSKLTRILQSSLGGNAKTSIICTVTPAMIDETHSTLQFASTAKTIKNKPIVNEVLSDEALLKRCTKEIEVLQKKLEMQNEIKKDQEFKKMELKLQETSEKNQLLEQQLTKLKERIVTSSVNSVPQEAVNKFNQNYRRLTWGGPRFCKMLLPHNNLTPCTLPLSVLHPSIKSSGESCIDEEDEIFVPAKKELFDMAFPDDCHVLTNDAECQTDLANLSRQIESAELEAVKSRIESLTMENTTLSRKIATLKNGLKTERARRTAEQCQNLDSTFVFLKEENLVQDKEIKNLEEKVTALTKSSLESEAQLKELYNKQVQENVELRNRLLELERKLQDEHLESQKQLQKQLDMAQKKIEKLTIELKDSEIQYEHNHKHADVVKCELRQQLQAAYDRIDYLEQNNACLDISKLEVCAKESHNKSIQELTLGVKDFSRLFNKLPNSPAKPSTSGIDYDSEMQIVQMEFELREAAHLENIVAKDSRIEELASQLEDTVKRHTNMQHEMEDLKMSMTKVQEKEKFLITELEKAKINCQSSVQELDVMNWEARQCEMMKKIADLEEEISNYKSMSCSIQQPHVFMHNYAIPVVHDANPDMHEKINALLKIVEEYCQKEQSYIAEHPFCEDLNFQNYWKESQDYQEQLQRKIEDLRRMVIQFKQNEQHVLGELQVLKAELQNRQSLGNNSTRTQQDAEDTIIQQTDQIAEMSKAIQEMKQKEKHLVEKLENLEDHIRKEEVNSVKDVEGELIEMQKKAERLEADIMEYKLREEALSGKNFCPILAKQDASTETDPVAAVLATEEHAAIINELDSLREKLLENEILISYYKEREAEEALKLTLVKQKASELEQKNVEMEETVMKYARNEDAHLEELSMLRREKELHQDCQKRITELQIEVTQCTQREKQLRQYNQTLETDEKSKSDGNLNYRELLDELNSIREREVRLRDGIKEKDVKLKDMQQQVRSYEEKVDSLQQQLYDLKNEHDVLQTHLLEMEEQEAGLESRVEAEKKLTAKIQEEFTQKELEMQRMVEMAEMRARELEIEGEKTRNQYQMLNLKHALRNACSVGVQCHLESAPIVTKTTCNQVQRSLLGEVAEAKISIPAAETKHPATINRSTQYDIIGNSNVLKDGIGNMQNLWSFTSTRGIQCELITVSSEPQQNIAEDSLNSFNQTMSNTLKTSVQVNKPQISEEEYIQLKEKLDKYEKKNATLVHDIREVRGTFHEYTENKRMMQNKLSSLQENLEYMNKKCDQLKAEIRHLNSMKNMSIVGNAGARKQVEIDDPEDISDLLHSGSGMIMRNNMEELKTKYDQLQVKYEKLKKLFMKQTSCIQQTKQVVEKSPRHRMPTSSADVGVLTVSTNSGMQHVIENTPPERNCMPDTKQVVEHSPRNRMQIASTSTAAEVLHISNSALQRDNIENKLPEEKVPLIAQRSNSSQPFSRHNKQEDTKSSEHPYSTTISPGEIRRILGRNRNPMYNPQHKQEVEDNCKVS